MNRGDIVWHPDPIRAASSPLGEYQRFLQDRLDLDFGSYEELHAWSTAEPSAFWASIWEFYGIRSHSSFEPGLVDARMPGATWFPGATLNYAEQVLGPARDGIAVIERSQTRGRSQLSWEDLRTAVAAVRTALLQRHVQPGDTVAMYGSTTTEALVVYLACAAIGAVHSSCPAEFGAEAVIKRLEQIAPKVLIAVDGYGFGRREIDRLDEVAAIADAIGSIEEAVVVPYLGRGQLRPGMTPWADFIAVGPEPLEFTAVPFDHPLVVVYTSGTTGSPKPIVHSHGGVLLEHLKSLGLQLGLGSTDRFFWYTTIGWMMWNYLVSGLLVGATVVLFDGDPGHPDAAALWRLAADEGITVFGVSPRFLQLTRRDVGPTFGGADLSLLRTISSTGSPLGVEEYEWLYETAGLDVALVSASGGTDVLSAFVCWAPTVPVYAGEISCAALGVDVAVVDPIGQEVLDEEGELVIRQPMPSMPIGFWNDPSGARFHASYFAANPGLWTQGDWATMTDRKTFLLTGRSDATLNRRGIRVGTAELYAVVEEVLGVEDSLAVCLEATGARDDVLVLLVDTGDEPVMDQALEVRICAAIKRRLSPRHIPDVLMRVSTVPRNSAGKKAELPVKHLLQSRFGDDPHEEARRFQQSLATPSLEVIQQLRDLRDGRLAGG